MRGGRDEIESWCHPPADKRRWVPLLFFWLLVSASTLVTGETGGHRLNPRVSLRIMALWLKLWPILKNEWKKGRFPFPSCRFISLATEEAFYFWKRTEEKVIFFLLLFLFFFSFSTHAGLVSSPVIMKAAVESGDVKKLAELIRQDPGFKVNMAVDGYGSTLLHHACDSDSRSAMIPLLLAHPDINVNPRNKFRWTPFFCACFGHTCVREMLKDSRVKVNEPAKNGQTPLWRAARNGHLDVIKVWIASGREMDLGNRGCRQDGCHWRGKEERPCGSGDPAGEIQGEPDTW